MFPVAPVIMQSAVLLILGQVVLGALGFAVPDRYPWLGLPLLLLFMWLIVRTARVVRQELEGAAKKRQTVVPWRVALSTALIWQVPALIGWAVLAWLPDWVPAVWHGTALPAIDSLDRWIPALGLGATSWVTVAVAVLEAVLFGFIAGRPLAPVVTPKAAQEQAHATVAAAASGEWAPARRHKDAMKRHRNLGNGNGK